ncbi:MAG: polysaccharide biosynthesis protein [Gammaproteobacteria bacterium]
MSKHLKTWHLRAAAFLHDLMMIPLAWLCAYWLRFNLGSIPQEFLTAGVGALFVVVPVQAVFYWYVGLYRGVWRFASLPDLMRIGQAVLAGALVCAAVLFMVTRLQGVPRSVFPLYAIILGGLLGGPRFAFRWFKDYHLRSRTGQRVIIVGAGQGGELLIRDLMRDPECRYRPVAFLDDDLAKSGREIHGLRVLGTSDDLPAAVDRLDARMVMIAIPSATSRQMKRLVELAERTGLPVRTLPSIHDVMAGRAGMNDLREVLIEDLLGREPVALNWNLIRSRLSGKAVLITGAGGSIGAELCRQIAQLSPGKLVVLDHSEFNLYELDLDLKTVFPDVETSFHLCNVCDEAAVRRLMQRHAPEVVFHAAAYKHVSMLESQLREAVHNNVLGTKTVAEAAHAARVSQFVLISTDKAVNPVNVMGASKRAAEIICENLQQRSATRFTTVRFGNVLGSAGSVVPLFRKQIGSGGPVTVTHPEVMRYFMTIPEACQLIMQAAAMCESGEIFVLDMGEPVKISDLAEQMIRLSGKVPGAEIEIVYTGLRAGEKLFEELFHDQEALRATKHKKILLARHRHVDSNVLKSTLAEMAEAVAHYDEARLQSLLHRLAPEFPTQAGESATAAVVPFTPRAG